MTFSVLNTLYFVIAHFQTATKKFCFTLILISHNLSVCIFLPRAVYDEIDIMLACVTIVLSSIRLAWWAADFSQMTYMHIREVPVEKY